MVRQGETTEMSSYGSLDVRRRQIQQVRGLHAGRGLHHAQLRPAIPHGSHHPTRVLGDELHLRARAAARGEWRVA